MFSGVVLPVVPVPVLKKPGVWPFALMLISNTHNGRKRPRVKIFILRVDLTESREKLTVCKRVTCLPDDPNIVVVHACGLLSILGGEAIELVGILSYSSLGRGLRKPDWVSKIST